MNFGIRSNQNNMQFHKDPYSPAITFGRYCVAWRWHYFVIVPTLIVNTISNDISFSWLWIGASFRYKEYKTSR